MAVIKSLILPAIIFFVFFADAEASSRCMVTDPTGTPLNIRDRDRHIIGTIRNGNIVRILADGYDDRGKPWALISAPGGRAGWVYREFISCY